MTSVTFETASLADAIKKAARVAPSKSGHAFDKAAGIVIDIFPDDEVQCVVRATNTDIFSTEIVTVGSATGGEARWRLSSMVLANVVGSLPISNGKTVTFTQMESSIRITSGRTKATLMLMDPTLYPMWDAFESASQTQVNGLGGRLAQVEWAASSAPTPPWCGVLLDGEYAVATDRYRLARVPCKIDLGKPVVVPAGILGNVLRPMGDVSISMQGSMLEISVDAYHHVQTITYDMPFPDLSKVTRTDHPCVVEVNKAEFLDMANRASAFAGADRAPILKTFFGRSEIAVMMENAEVGMLGDVIEVPGQIEHPRVTINFTPKNLTDGIAKAPGAKVKLGYDPENLKHPVYISDGSGYEAWIVPRGEMKAE